MADEKPASVKGGTAAATSDSGFLKMVRDNYEEGYNKERQNIDDAYDDLAFRAGDQWPADAKRLRVEDGNRPCLTVNLLPQFVRQVTGDIRQMRPAMQVLPVDDEADEEVAEDIGGLIRYIENQGDAQAAYYNAADAAVTCGIGAWRVDREYLSPRTFNQEIRIRGIDDPVAVIWDPNAVELTREDAMWCIVPIDMSWSSFKKKYPDASVMDYNGIDLKQFEGWYTSETVRVAEYWCKKRVKAKLALSPDGSVVEVEKADPETLAKIQAESWRVEDRDIFRVYRAVVSGADILEPETVQLGRYIPIVPFIGEEVKIGRRTVRHGVVRFAKDPQRIFNYFHSAEVEVTALAPKAPWIGTDKQFENHLEIWETANTQNHSYLPYTPDPTAPGAPQRVAPPPASVGISNAIERSAQNMKAVIGIYDAQLGARSNETSGVAIRARQSEGDTGTYVYKDNFARALRHTARIAIDMIPDVYDTARTIRILGEDGKMKAVDINQPVQVPVMQGEGEPAEDAQRRMNKDMTRGSYDVTVTMGPSYSTKSQEALDGMTSFIQAAPQIAPMVMDLFAKSNEWPMAKEISERLETMLPPEIRAKMEAKKQGIPEDQIDAFLQQQQSQKQPDPAEQMAMQGAQIELATKDANRRKAVADADKSEAELAKLLAMPIAQPGNTAEQGQVTPVNGEQASTQPMQGQAGGVSPEVGQALQDLGGAVQEIMARMEELTNVVREIAPPIMEELAARGSAGEQGSPDMPQEVPPLQ